MVGGTTSGYSLMGSRHIAMKPTMKMRAESTPAKIGLRIKKCEKFISLCDLISQVAIGSAISAAPFLDGLRSFGRPPTFQASPAFLDARVGGRCQQFDRGPEVRHGQCACLPGRDRASPALRALSS